MGARVVAATLEELEKGKRRERKREREVGGEREREREGGGERERERGRGRERGWRSGGGLVDWRIWDRREPGDPQGFRRRGVQGLMRGGGQPHLLL